MLGRPPGTAHDRLAEADQTGVRNWAWLVEFRLATYIFVETNDDSGRKYEVDRGWLIGTHRREIRGRSGLAHRNSS